MTRRREPLIRLRRPASLLCPLVACFVLLAGCELAPRKPDAAFVLYREKMKAGDLKTARLMLSDDSRNLTLTAAGKYKLPEPPENLALLNILDPVGQPTVMKEADTEALLQMRTLKGGLRLVHLVRRDEKSPWEIDMSEELKALRFFLEARGALDMVRGQAGDFAAASKSFADQLDRMKAPNPPAVTESPEKSEKTSPKAPEKKKKGRP
jgi:hypothetical protein